MKECLVTKLKGTVDNDNLPKLGHFYVDVPAGNIHSSDSTVLYFRPAQESLPFTLTIIGDGYFTDSAYTQNLGKSLTVTTSGSSTQVFVYSQNGCSIDIPDNYKGNRCSVYKGTLRGGIQYRIDNYIDGINGLLIDGEEVDITAGNKPDSANILRGTGVYGDLTNTIKLSIVYALPFSKLSEAIALSEKGITFDASIYKTTSSIGKYGCSNKWVDLYWNGDATNDTIPGVDKVNFGTYLDTALIEMAGRTGAIPVNEVDRIIVVKGNKTVLSDAAVATLKQKGFAVTINDVEQ